MRLESCFGIAIASALLAVSFHSSSADSAKESLGIDTNAFFKRLNEKKTSLAKYVYLTSSEVQLNPQLREVSAQMLSTLLSLLGRPADARDIFPSRKPAPDEMSSPPEQFAVIPADIWITEQAKTQRVVMINEAHHKAETRVLTLQLLPRLRALGYTHFAVETLNVDDPELQRRGYPIAGTGFYTAEPVFGEIIREAIKLGYVLVAYESTTVTKDTQQQREDGQAHNLFKRTIGDNPDAKVLVHAGYSHISKAEIPEFAKPMAMQFMALSKLPVLSIDQTQVVTATRSAQEISVPSVAIDKSGRAWSGKPEQHDATVLLPTFSAEKSPHPQWLSLYGRRQAVAIDFSSCGMHLPCLAEARHTSESDEAIPADQFLMLNDNETRTPLYLAPGKYRLRLLGREGTTLIARELVVSPQVEAAR